MRGDLQDLKTFSPEDLSQLMPQFNETDINRHTTVLAEFDRRSCVAQIEAAEAQRIAATAEEKAANAAIESARHAERNAKYMLWSVFAAAASAFISLLSTLRTNWPKH
jgi:hypothetical protein